MSSPHDALFKYVFSQPENAASELRAVLPPELSARLDWSSLAAEPASFVDARLMDRHADLLFSVRCDGRESFLYVLLEHQSSPDTLMAFRLLRYVVRIWDRFLQSHPDARRLPAVIPVVIHHSGAGWSAPTDLAALIDLDADTMAACSSFLPRFQFVLDDLTRADDEELHGRLLTAMAEAGLLLLARGRSSPDLAADLRRWAHILKQIADAPNGLGALSALLEYAVHVGEVAPEDLRRLVHELGPVAEEAYVTTAQKLTEEALARGKAEGKVEGNAEGKAQLVLRQLTLRFGPLSPSATEQVHGATPELLELWAERVLTASSLDEVLR